ncbi:MAG: hypothetical protein ACRD1C_03795 [Terriglobales bacterium]
MITLVALAALAASGCVHAQTLDRPPMTRVAGAAVASEFQFSAQARGPVGPPGGTVTVSDPSFTLPDGTPWVPFAVGTPVQISGDANPEVVTVTGVSCSTGGPPCSFVADFSASHPGSFTVSSATDGLQEAINYEAQHGGGSVIADPDWGGSVPSLLSELHLPSDVLLIDETVGDFNFYGEGNGSAPKLIAAFSSSTGTNLGGGGGASYPPAGVPNSTGAAWGSSFQVGTAANDLVQLNASGQLPPVSAANLINFPILNQNTSGQSGTTLAFAFAPTQCAAGEAAAGIATNGGATGCFTPSGSGDLPTEPGSPNGTALGLVETPAGGTSQTAAWTADALGVNAQVGTSYTIEGDPASGASDLSALITADNAAAQTYTLCLLGTTGCGQGFFFSLLNLGLGNVTFVPGTGQAVMGDPVVPPGYLAQVVATSATEWLVEAVPVEPGLANAASGGTAVNELAKMTSAGLVATATTDTTGAIGIVTANAGTSAAASVAASGIAGCQFDATTVTEGDWVQISSTTAGDCHDAGASKPASGEIIGHAAASGAASSVQPVLVEVAW